MNDRNIRLLIAYDGTDFSGWQRQNRNRSVQGEIEQALEKIHKHPVVLTGSGRTDAGVHARGQVANFKTSIQSIPAERFIPALNSLLSRDIRILRAYDASDTFHARFDAKKRTYRYQIICGRPALPHELRYALQLWRIPDIRKLNSLCRNLLGELDCSVFANPSDPSKSRSRYIFHACFFFEHDYLVFEISANAFLWKMVRSIVGSLLYYEENNMSTGAFVDILKSGDRRLAGPTAVPQGLYLWNIEYYKY